MQHETLKQKLQYVKHFVLIENWRRLYVFSSLLAELSPFSAMDTLKSTLGLVQKFIIKSVLNLWNRRQSSGVLYGRLSFKLPSNPDIKDLDRCTNLMSRAMKVLCVSRLYPKKSFTKLKMRYPWTDVTSTDQKISSNCH